MLIAETGSATNVEDRVITEECSKRQKYLGEVGFELESI